MFKKLKIKWLEWKQRTNYKNASIFKLAGTIRDFDFATSHKENRMNNVIVNIKHICTKYNMSVSARLCYALIVEYFLCNGNKDDIREVLEENCEYFPLDIIPAASEIVEYLKISNVVLLDYSYSDEVYGSWQKFDINGQVWYVLFTLINGRRSDFADGGYMSKTIDEMPEVR